jgi:predicted RNA polymerase sigma factor
MGRPGAIAEGVTLITETLARAPIGPYQLQAAIAAVHDEAAYPEDTDWGQILGLYELLNSIAPGPMVTLNRIVAVANGPRRTSRFAAAWRDGGRPRARRAPPGPRRSRTPALHGW